MLDYETLRKSYKHWEGKVSSKLLKKLRRLQTGRVTAAINMMTNQASLSELQWAGNWKDARMVLQ